MWTIFVLLFLLLLSSKRFVNFLFRVIVWSLDVGVDIEYDLDKLSGEAKNQLVSLQFVDQELQKLNAQAAVLQTARMAYANALKEALPKEKRTDL